MSRKSHRPPDDERRRTRRALLAMAVAAGLAGGVFLLAWGPWRGPGHGHGDREHPHLTAPHGGCLASLGEHEPHDHAEAVLEPGGLLAVYTLQADARLPRPVAAQVLTAWVRPAEGGEATRMVLPPMPLQGDALGTTSRFKGKLPKQLWGRMLALTMAELAVGDDRFKVEFDQVRSSADAGAHVEAERRLYLTPGGKYTEADIEANGSTTARQKYGEFEAKHDLDPTARKWVCPVSLVRSTPGFSWVVDGKPYRFCCPPCIDEFVRLAKDEPERIKRSEEYLKR